MYTTYYTLPRQITPRSLSPFLHYCLVVSFLPPFLTFLFFPCYVNSAISHSVISQCQGIMGNACHSPTCFLFMTWIPRENKLRYTPLTTHYPLFIRTYPFTLILHTLLHHHTHSHMPSYPAPSLSSDTYTPHLIYTPNHLKDHLPLDP